MLIVAGEPRAAALRAEIERAAAGDPRIELRLAFVPDEALQVYLRAADLVVLPYEEILNSGAALLALSFDCPILVPDKGSLEVLRADVGPDWVRLYQGALSTETLSASAGLGRPRPRGAGPAGRLRMGRHRRDHPGRLSPGARERAMTGKHLAILVPTLDGGGAERVMLYIVPGLVRLGYRIDLVVCRAQGHLRGRLPPEARLVELKRSSILAGRLNVLASDPRGFGVLARPMLFPLKTVWALRYGPALRGYLERETPDILLSGGQYFNLVALWARRRARVPTRVVITEHTVLTPNIEARPGHWRHQYRPPLLRRTYPWADAVVSVSRGVGDDLAKITGLARARIRTIYNPVVTPDLAALAQAPLEHPWLTGEGPPVLLAAGRLVSEKDFPTLLRAFARVRKARDARLIILGSGTKLGATLDDLIRSLGIAEQVAFEGWVENPFAYMSRASVFVLSSLYEGLGNVLIEAMACGCPVVATDCPGGPPEILEQGRYGPLVPIGDDAAMAEAILAVLDQPIDDQTLKHRADDFTVARAVAQYHEVFQTV